MRKLIVPLLAIFLLAGCGGSGQGDSAEQQIKDANVEFVEAVRDDDIGKACDLTNDPKACRGQFRLVGDTKAFLPDDLEDQIRDGTVAVEGTSATLTVNGEKTKMVRRNGDWLIVIER